jgi:hypothetical protein
MKAGDFAAMRERSWLMAYGPRLAEGGTDAGSGTNSVDHAEGKLVNRPSPGRTPSRTRCVKWNTSSVSLNSKKTLTSQTDSDSDYYY